MFLTARGSPGQRGEAEGGDRERRQRGEVEGRQRGEVERSGEGRAEPGRSVDTQDRRSYGPGSDQCPWSQVPAGESGPLGKSLQLDSRGSKRSLMSFLCKLSPAQLLQCWLWLYARLPPAAAQGLARRCPQGISLSQGTPTFLLTLVSPFVIGLFTGRAKTGKRETETESE